MNSENAKPKSTKRLSRIFREKKTSHDASEVEEGSEVVCWPMQFLPKLVQNCRIMSWGYDADVAHFFRPAGANTTFQHAQGLLAEIERQRRSNPNPHPNPHPNPPTRY